MAFQPEHGTIRYKLHLNADINTVFEALSTDNGRATFWAESAIEDDGYITFNILNYEAYKAKIIESSPPTRFSLNYFGTIVTFDLDSDEQGGTDLSMTAAGCSDSIKFEMSAGWVSVLLAMKAAVDFGVDLRNHDKERAWEQGYVDN